MDEEILSNESEVGTGDEEELDGEGGIKDPDADDEEEGADDEVM